LIGESEFANPRILADLLQKKNYEVRVSRTFNKSEYFDSQKSGLYVDGSYSLVESENGTAEYGRFSIWKKSRAEIEKASEDVPAYVLGRLQRYVREDNVPGMDKRMTHHMEVALQKVESCTIKPNNDGYGLYCKTHSIAAGPRVESLVTEVYGTDPFFRKQKIHEVKNPPGPVTEFVAKLPNCNN
jgi:hypothetical protein